MAETLGSLCDKLTVVKLKQFHTEDSMSIQSLAKQEKQLQSEINNFIHAAIKGQIPHEQLTFAPNKVYKKEGNSIPDIKGNIGEVFTHLAKVNCDLWHEQEKVYDFEKVPVQEKNLIVKKLALLNLERNQCINKIDKEFQELIQQKSKSF